MTDPETPDAPQRAAAPSRPDVPEYGEYAEPDDFRFYPPPTAAPAPALASAQPGTRRRDAIWSAVLLGIGFVSSVNVITTALNLDAFLHLAYKNYGGTGDYSPSGDLSIAGGVLVVSHVVLFAATVLITRSLVAAGRLSFWVPLVAGAIAFIVLFTTIGILISSDPALVGAAETFLGVGGVG